LADTLCAILLAVESIAEARRIQPHPSRLAILPVRRTAPGLSPAMIAATLGLGPGDRKMLGARARSSYVNAMSASPPIFDSASSLKLLDGVRTLERSSEFRIARKKRGIQRLLA
jgi:hypothetical protein